MSKRQLTLVFSAAFGNPNNCPGQGWILTESSSRTHPIDKEQRLNKRQFNLVKIQLRTCLMSVNGLSTPCLLTE